MTMNILNLIVAIARIQKGAWKQKEFLSEFSQKESRLSDPQCRISTWRGPKATDTLAVLLCRASKTDMSVEASFFPS